MEDCQRLGDQEGRCIELHFQGGGTGGFWKGGPRWNHGAMCNAFDLEL